MKEVLKILNKYNSFALFSHISPDADALGSMNALRLTLKKMGKKAFVFCDGKIPHNIAFLKVPLEEKYKKIAKCDVCIMIDCNSLDRIGKYAEYFDNAKIKVNIDHHQSMNYKFDYSYCDSTSPSTADLMYEIIKNLEVTINSDIALNLYAGLSSDTGCFQHPSTNNISHKHAYELINYKFDLQEANYNMFKYKQKNYLYFYKSVLRNTKSYLNEKVYITFFNYKTYKRFEKVC
ncbi:MAG: DHH family phosphoesterase, partial [Clostridia bacterium]|nr:DHH family phosphoesterase [Clostridia bacterium]